MLLSINNIWKLLRIRSDSINWEQKFQNVRCELGPKNELFWTSSVYKFVYTSVYKFVGHSV